jgi:hypothetical protein
MPGGKYLPANDWTTKKVKLLKYWQEECRLYNWLYNQNVQYYQQVNRNLSIVSVLLSAITGATLLNNADPPNPGLILAFGIVSIISSFIQGLRQFLDLDNKISANTFTSRQNSAIVIDIEEQLNLAREERINGTEFIKSIKTRKNAIIQSAPLISKSRWAQLKKKIKAGEGISFFNESVFKTYLESTVKLGDLKLDTPDDEEEPPATPRSDGLQYEHTISPDKLEAITIAKKSSPTSSINSGSAFTPLNRDDILTTNSLLSRYSTPESVVHIPPQPSPPVSRRTSPISVPLEPSSRRDMSSSISVPLEPSSRRDMSSSISGPDSILSSSRRNMLSFSGTEYFPANKIAQPVEVGSEDELINELQGDNLCVQQLRHSLYTEPKSPGKVLAKHKLAEVLKYHMGRF